MKDYILAEIIYIGFFSILGYALHLTGSAHVLWALLLVPSIKLN